MSQRHGDEGYNPSRNSVEDYIVIER